MRTSPRWPVFVIGYAVLALGTVLYLGPFVIQFANSFKTDPDAAQAPLSLIADPFSLQAWRKAFGLDTALEMPIMRWLGNSFFAMPMSPPSNGPRKFVPQRLASISARAWE